MSRRRHLRFLGFAAVMPLLAAGAAAGAPTIPSWTKAAAEAWWKGHPEPASWIAGAADLEASLRATQDRHGVAKSLGNAHFLKWVAHLRWLRCLPDDPAGGLLADPANHAAFFALGQPDAGVVEILAQSLTSYDDAAKAVEILCAIQRAQPEEFAEYRNLALAIALVFDQPFPDAWPHPNVAREKIPVGDLDPARRFAFAVASHKAGLFLLDPRALSVRELVFLVDTMIELREFQYAQQVKLGTPGRLGQLYPVVPYDMPRITGENYLWPHPAYRLIDVGKKGGICVDQAYFVSQTGKAQGVPTVLFMGQGRSGGHAWVGILEERGRWNLEVARFKGEKYPVGLAFDPQSWRRVTDAQMRFRIQEEKRGAEARGQTMLQWALLNRNEPFFREVVSTARAAMPRSFEAWELEAGWFARQPDQDLEAQQSFWQAWVANFRDEPDMRARGQRMLLAVLRKSGDESAAERIQKAVLAENRNDRFDLGIRMAADVVLERIDAGDWDGARKEFEAVARRYQRNAGGHLFYNLLEPYVRRCLQDGRVDDAESAIKECARAFKPIPGSILDTDLKKLSREVEALGKG